MDCTLTVMVVELPALYVSGKKIDLALTVYNIRLKL